MTSLNYGTRWSRCSKKSSTA